MHRRGVARPFRRITAALLGNAEQMRTTRSLARFVDGAVREGRWMVELLLLILGEWSTPKFDEFMRRLAAPANLVDKLRDAGRDFARGEICIHPGLRFRLCLGREIFAQILRLAPFCVGRRGLLGWGVHSLCRELAARPGEPMPPANNAEGGRARQVLS